MDSFRVPLSGCRDPGPEKMENYPLKIMSTEVTKNTEKKILSSVFSASSVDVISIPADLPWIAFLSHIDL